MSVKILLSLKKANGLWIYYNLLTQTLVETSVSPELIHDQAPSNIHKDLFFGENIQDLLDFNNNFYKKTLDVLEEEKDLTQYFNQKSQVIIVLWYSCNFDCSYCFQKYTYYDFKPEKDIIDVQKLKQFFTTKSDGGKLSPDSVVLLGGEPLLKGKKYKTIIEEILDYLSSEFKDLEISIVTNGYNLNYYIPTFLKYKNIDWIFNITLGIDEKHHSEERILKADRSANTRKRILENIEKISINLPKSTVYIKLNLGKDFIEVKNVINLIKGLKNNEIISKFEISPIESPEYHQEINNSFIELSKSLLLEESIRNKIDLRYSQHIFNIIRKAFIDKSETEIEVLPKWCNAIVFSTNYDLSPPFQIQPCEDFRYYEIDDNLRLKIESSFLEKFNQRITNVCVNCPFLTSCLSNPCNIVKRINQPLEKCYGLERSNIITALSTVHGANHAKS